jgi:hypothetical protein
LASPAAMLRCRSSAKPIVPSCAASVRPYQGDARGGELPEVDGVTAAGAADGDRDVVGVRRGGVPLAQHAEPPDEVAVAVAARWPVVRADGQVHLAAARTELLGDLSTRGAGADHEHSALGELLRVAVRRGVDLVRHQVLADDARRDGDLERAGRRDHVAGGDGALAGLDEEARGALPPRHGAHLDAGADRGIEAAREGAEVVGHLVLGGELVWSDAGDLHVGEAVVPGGAVGDQGVPAAVAPAIGDVRLLQDDVGDAQAGEMGARGDAGLAGADDHDLSGFCGPRGTGRGERPDGRVGGGGHGTDLPRGSAVGAGLVVGVRRAAPRAAVRGASRGPGRRPVRRRAPCDRCPDPRPSSGRCRGTRGWWRR